MGELKAKARLLRFTGDVWKNHPCCVVTMHENHLAEQRAWSQKVVNAVVKAEIFASQNRQETARILSKGGYGYLPFAHNIVDRAMNHYQDDIYTTIGANKNSTHWHNHRIDFQPWPYPSATRFLVEAMNKTLVEGDTTFLTDLSADFVVNDLVDYQLVKNALALFPQWVDDASVTNKQAPFERTEVFDV